MEYGFSMNLMELKISMAMFNKQELEGIAVIDEKFSPTHTDLKNMYKKRFIEEHEGWNPLVRLIFHCVFNADCKLRLYQNNGSTAVVYFKDDIMVLMHNETDNDLYHFYFVPFIPKAVGGLSSIFDFLRDSTDKTNEVDMEIPVSSEIENSCQLLELVSEKLDFNKDEAFFIGIEGEIMEYTDYKACLLQCSQGYVYAVVNDDVINCKSTDYYDFIKYISEWLIYVHGSCIKWSENK